MASTPGQADARTLLELAVDVHTDLGKLATALAHAGAQPQAVQVLQHMDGIIAELVKVLGAGPTGALGQGGEAPGAPAPEAAPAPEPQAAAGPPQGPTPGARPNGFHEASAQLQAALASKHAAAQRALAAGQ